MRKQYAEGTRGGVQRHELGKLLTTIKPKKGLDAIFEENFVRRAVLTMPLTRSLAETFDVNATDEEDNGPWKTSIRSTAVLTFVQKSQMGNKRQRRGGKNAPPAAQSLALVMEMSTPAAAHGTKTSALRFFEGTGEEMHTVHMDKVLAQPPAKKANESVRLMAVDAENNDPFLVAGEKHRNRQ